MSTDGERQDLVWQGDDLVRTFVNDVRGGVPYGADQIEIMLRVVAARRAPLWRFADLGCGSGVLARALLARFPGAEAVLVDFSEPMLATARRELGDRIPPVAFVSADLAAPAWVDAVRAYTPFDVIVSGYAIHHLSDERKRALYGEVYALLAPGGLFLNIEHVASATPWVAAIADELMIDSIWAFQQERGSGKTLEQVAKEFVYRPDKAANILAPVADQCAWLRDIGFDDVDCYFKACELAVFGGRKPAG